MTALLWAGAISFCVALFGMPVLMRWLASRGIGQPIRLDGPQAHIKKSGTPTMGGIMIVIAAVAGYMVPHFVTDAVPFSRGGQLVMLAFVGAGLVGLADDWIKVTQKRSLGTHHRSDKSCNPDKKALRSSQIQSPLSTLQETYRCDNRHDHDNRIGYAP